MQVRVDRGTSLTPLAAPRATFEGRVARVHPEGDPLKYDSGPEYRTREELQRIVDQLVGIPVTLYHPDGLLSGGATGRVVGKIIAARLDGDFAVATIEVSDLDAVPEIRDGARELSLGYSCNIDENRFQYDTRVDHLGFVPAARCGADCAARVDAAGGMKLCPCGDEECPLAENYDEVLVAQTRNTLSPDDFAVPGMRKLPIHDEPHVRAAMARLGQTQGMSDEERRSAYRKILARARSMGIDTEGFEQAHKHMDGVPCCKSCAMRYDQPTTPMPEAEKIVMDELKTQLSAALADAANQRTRADAADARAVAAENKATQCEITADNARAETAVEKARADAAVATAATDIEKVRTDAAAQRQADVNARVKLLTQANQVLGAADAEGKPVDRTSMVDRDIKIAVIKHVDGSDVASEKPDLYVDGIYDGALQRHAKGSGSRVDAVVAIQQMREEGATRTASKSDEGALQADLRSRYASAWMTEQE